MKIYFATRVRGFFRQLFKEPTIDADFVYDQSKIYETNSIAAKIKNRLGRSLLFDWLGIIQIIKCRRDEDIYGSFNRFLDSDKPYFIYVENPTALYHYRLERNKHIIGRQRIKKSLTSSSLKALVFMSKACGDTFEQVCNPIPDTIIQEVIYPYIPLNPHINEEYISRKSRSAELKLLYIAQGIRFLSKGGLEIIEAYKRLKKIYPTISLRIITSIKDVDRKIIDDIQKIEGATLCDFKYSFEEMQEIYAQSHILLQPTSDDSSPLTILEAVKSGLPVIASRLYAIPEMVEDGINGYLCDPHYWFFDKQNIPNEAIWNNRAKTIYSGKKSEDIVDFLIAKITQLYNDRQLLENLSLASFNKAKRPPFDTKYIVEKWNSLIKRIR